LAENCQNKSANVQTGKLLDAHAFIKLHSRVKSGSTMAEIRDEHSSGWCHRKTAE